MNIEYDLFERCKKGDAKAQQILYDLFKARLMGLSRRYARHYEDAQDILQESFVKIFSRFHQIKTVDKMEGWMKAVVVNTAISHYHKNQSLRNQIQVEAMSDEDALYIHPDLIEDHHLINIINSLPDGCRLVFNLFAIEGYSHAEISEMLTISEGTSRSQFHHAKQLIKEKLKCQNLVHYYERFA